MTLTVGSLFSGIGGLDLGLERAGMKVLWQVEKDPYARKVLRRNWPDVPCFTDVRGIQREDCGCLIADGNRQVWPVDVLCGGFPCQDISNAGKRAGIDGERSGLWSEFSRLIRELRPRFVLVENVAALLVRGLDRVLGDLAASGFDAEWDCIPAAAVGAHHRRDRLFVVAHANGERRKAGGRVFNQDACRSLFEEVGQLGGIPRLERGRSGRVWPVPDTGIHRVADVPPSWVDRLRVTGNAVVPRVAELIGRRILAVA